MGRLGEQGREQTNKLTGCKPKQWAERQSEAAESVCNSLIPLILRQSVTMARPWEATRLLLAGNLVFKSPLSNIWT